MIAEAGDHIPQDTLSILLTLPLDLLHHMPELGTSDKTVGSVNFRAQDFSPGRADSRRPLRKNQEPTIAYAFLTYSSAFAALFSRSVSRFGTARTVPRYTLHLVGCAVLAPIFSNKGAKLDKALYQTVGNDECATLSKSTEGQIPLRLKVLGENLDELSGRLRELEDRLSPALIHHPEPAGIAKCGSNGIPVAESEISAALTDHTDKIRSLQYRIGDLLQDLTV